MSFCRFSLLVVATLGVAVPLAANGQQASITWRSNLDAARQEASQTGRNLLVHFWAPWCGPCQRLESTVFNQGSVATVLQQGLVPVKLNYDEFPQIARAFGVDRLPTDVILRPDGTVLAKFASPQDPSTYLAQVAPFSTAAGAMGLAAGQGGAAGGAIPAHRGPVQSAYANLAAPRQEMTAAYADVHQQNPTVPVGYGGHSIAGGYGPYAAKSATPPQAVEDPSRAYRGANYDTHQPGRTAGPETHAGSPDAYGSRYSSQETGQLGSPSVGLASSPARGAIAQGQTGPSAAPRIGDVVVSPPPSSSAFAHDSPSATSAHPASTVAAGGGMAETVTATNPPPFGLDGFCPVTLKQEQRWVAGDKRYGVVHRGKLYLFAGPQQQQQFWTDPDGYSPVLSGIDPVLALDNGASVQGQREHGVEYNGQVYLFSSESTLQHFSRNPERYAGGVRQAMQGSSGTTIR